MTLLKDNNYKDINVALLSLEADIKNKITNFDTSVIDKQLAEINSRIDKINAGGNNTSAAINDIRYEIEDINSKLNGNSVKIENIEQKLTDIFSAENKVTDFNTTTNSGIYYWLDDAANRPSDYGVLLVNKYDGGSSTSIWINQVAYGTNSKIYFRQNINSGNWTEWKAVAFDGEITAKKVANALTVNGKTYDGSEAVDAGVQTVANGGTGATTEKEAFINLANGLSEDVNPIDTEHIIFKNTSGTNWGLYTLSTFWNYIKGKISSVLGLTKDTYGGKAATATSVEDGNNVVQYKAASLNGYKIQDTQEKALYVEGRELDSGDSGGIAITNDCVTAFGAGDTDGVFRVINEDNVSAGPVFKVMKDGQVYTTNTIHGSIDGSASTAGTADKVASTGVSTSWIYGRAEAICKTTSAGENDGWKTLASIKTASGSIEIGNLSGEDFIRVVYSSDADVSAGNNNVTQLLCIRRGNIEALHEFIANSAKASSKLVIPIGAPSSPEDGCIWIS